MRITNYATEPVVTVAPTDSIDRAIELMEDHGFHHLVVTDANQVCGILSDRDILISTGWMLRVDGPVPAGGRDDDGPAIVGPTRVDQIMTRSVATISRDD